MSTRYIIEGDLITTEQVETTQVGTVTDLLASLTSFQPLELSGLPRDIKYLKAIPQGDEAVTVRAIIQQPPQTREINYGAYEEETSNYAIAQPFYVFWFNMHGTPVRENGDITGWVWAPTEWGTAWMRQPFSSLDDPATYVHMPNHYTDTRVCFGINPSDRTESLGAYIDSLTNTYWHSIFNNDLDMRTPYGRRTDGSYHDMLGEWSYATEQDGAVWRNWDIWRNAMPLRELISLADNITAWTDPVPDSIASPAIPPLPITRTFYNVQGWLRELDDDSKARLRAALVTTDD